jgi:parvulin-like peptidyl-prolyl isomerase
MKRPASVLSLVIAVLFAACDKGPPAPGQPTSGGARPEKIANGEPAVVTVQHILIGVKGGQLPEAKREKAEAERFAFELLGRARSGEDFEKLGKEFTEDSGFRPYTITNEGIEPNEGTEARRGGMVKGFGDVSFHLNVGQIGMTDYDPTTSPFGYHIIKRIK